MVSSVQEKMLENIILVKDAECWKISNTQVMFCVTPASTLISLILKNWRRIILLSWRDQDDMSRVHLTMMSRTHSYKINIIDMNILSLISRYSSTSSHQNTDYYPQYISNRYDFIQLLNLGNTRRTVIVLSDSFLKQDWSRYDFRSGLQAAMRAGGKKSFEGKCCHSAIVFEDLHIIFFLLLSPILDETNLLIHNIDQPFPRGSSPDQDYANASEILLTWIVIVKSQLSSQPTFWPTF